MSTSLILHNLVNYGIALEVVREQGKVLRDLLVYFQHTVKIDFSKAPESVKSYFTGPFHIVEIVECDPSICDFEGWKVRFNYIDNPTEECVYIPYCDWQVLYYILL